jgi:hypothetical protein
MFAGEVPMPRSRWRATLESGPKLDLAKLIPKGAGKPGTHIRSTLTYASGEVITAELRLDHYGGMLEITSAAGRQSFGLAVQQRHFGGLQWYVVCPRTSKRVRVLFRPMGARWFASRHAFGRQVAYASQFLDPVGRAWRTKEKVKARLIGDGDPDEWDLPPRPKGMRQATYERWETRYDAAEERLEYEISLALARCAKYGL